MMAMMIIEMNMLNSLLPTINLPFVLESKHGSNKGYVKLNRAKVLFTTLHNVTLRLIKSESEILPLKP